MKPGKFVDSSEDYEMSAELWAREMQCKFDVKSSFMLLEGLFDIPQNALESIEADLQAFSERVDDYLYGIC